MSYRLPKPFMVGAGIPVETAAFRGRAGLLLTTKGLDPPPRQRCPLPFSFTHAGLVACIALPEDYLA